MNENFDLASYKKAKESMIATNSAAYEGEWRDSRYRNKLKDYTQEEIEQILNSGSLIEKQKLSRAYFQEDGFYRRIILHYATLLKYAGLLIPNPATGQKISAQHIQKRYLMALEFVDNASLPTFFVNCAIRALVSGTYYGLIQSADKKKFSIIDLPFGYCRSRFKDLYGNDIIEFDLSYFDSIVLEEERKDALEAYPKSIRKAYKSYSKNKKSKWYFIPSELGVCFPLFDGQPLFLNIIPATLQYDKAVELEIERDLEEIRKIIVQKIPHLNDGRLLFEPEEAQEMHDGAVKMLKGNKNLSVLTGYADVEAITSKTSAESRSTGLETMQQHIYSEAGVSSQIFGSTGSTTLESSLKNDLALMMYLANKFANFTGFLVNERFGNSNISFKYQILPVSYYNEEKYIDTAYKLASSGYSYLLPAVAMGINQRDLGDLKDLENNVLKLDEKLKPLTSAFQGSATSTSKKESGGQTKAQEEKAEKTIENEDSLDNQTGGSN